MPSEGDIIMGVFRYYAGIMYRLFGVDKKVNPNFVNFIGSPAVVVAENGTGVDITLDADLAAIAGLTPVNNDVIQRKIGVWTNRTIAQLRSDLGIGDTQMAIITNDISQINITSTNITTGVTST